MTAPTPQHPVVVRLNRERAANAELRFADRITAFAGSMRFVYLHVLVFTFWMLVVERSPWPTLTLVVSLESIFLSTFVMIGQNRQATFQQAKADHDFVEEVQELKLNTALTREIRELTRDLHEQMSERRGERNEYRHGQAGAAISERYPQAAKVTRRHSIAPRRRTRLVSDRRPVA